MPYCPQGHGQKTGQFCDECGGKLQATPPSPPAGAGDSLRVRSPEAHANVDVNVSPTIVMPGAAVDAQPTLVCCPLCGRRNLKTDVFDCMGGCGQKNLCLSHFDEEHLVCVGCAAEQRQAAETQSAAARQAALEAERARQERQVEAASQQGVELRRRAEAALARARWQEAQETAAEWLKLEPGNSRAAEIEGRAQKMLAWLGRGHAFEPEMVLVPAGEFLMGSDEDKDEGARADETPQHKVYLSDYAIGKTPVTKMQYAAFVEATAHESPEDWEGSQPPRGKEDHPVVYVSWNDALAYCRWLAKVTGKAYRLPTEAEWEKAARGMGGQIYAWGDQPPDETRANYGKMVGDTTSVGSYPAGASPYGCQDMAGNVWEWCRDWYAKGYYADSPQRNPRGPDSGTSRVVRGGSWYQSGRDVRATDRGRSRPGFRIDDVGFRCVSLSP